MEPPKRMTRSEFESYAMAGQKRPDGATDGVMFVHPCSNVDWAELISVSRTTALPSAPASNLSAEWITPQLASVAIMATINAAVCKRLPRDTMRIKRISHLPARPNPTPFGIRIRARPGGGAATSLRAWPGSHGSDLG